MLNYSFNMLGYTKLFGSLVQSTIWDEDKDTRLVWITMLALKDKDHIVEGSIPGLAHSARVTVEECRKALKKLSEPDADSRTKEFEGRRIKEIEGVGWLILNGEKYRKRMGMEEMRAYKAMKQAEYRERQKKEKKSRGGTMAERLASKGDYGGEPVETLARDPLAPAPSDPVERQGLTRYCFCGNEAAEDSSFCATHQTNYEHP